MNNQIEIDAINAWANILQALGQPGHDADSANKEVLREITTLVKNQLKLLAKTQ